MTTSQYVWVNLFNCSFYKKHLQKVQNRPYVLSFSYKLLRSYEKKIKRKISKHYMPKKTSCVLKKKWRNFLAALLIIFLST